MKGISWALVCLGVSFACNQAGIERRSTSLLHEQDNLHSSDAASSGQVTDQKYTFDGVTSDYRLRLPTAIASPNGSPLIVFFHGNLGSNFGPASISPQRILAKQDASTGKLGLGQPLPTIDQIVAESKENRFWDPYAVLAILTPTDTDRDYKGGKVITWGSMKSENSLIPEAQIDFNADFAHSLIESIIEKHNIDRSRVILVGQSGGSLFLANTMIPKYGPRYSGGAILLCGGEIPRTKYASNLTPDFASRFHLHFHTTNKELSTIVPLLKEGAQSYQALWKDADIKPDVQYDGDGKHCLFGSGTQPQIIQRVLESWNKAQ